MCCDVDLRTVSLVPVSLFCYVVIDRVLLSLLLRKSLEYTLLFLLLLVRICCKSGDVLQNGVPFSKMSILPATKQTIIDNKYMLYGKTLQIVSQT